MMGEWRRLSTKRLANRHCTQNQPCQRHRLSASSSATRSRPTGPITETDRTQNTQPRQRQAICLVVVRRYLPPDAQKSCAPRHCVVPPTARGRHVGQLLLEQCCPDKSGTTADGLCMGGQAVKGSGPVHQAGVRRELPRGALDPCTQQCPAPKRDRRGADPSGRIPASIRNRRP